VLKEVWAIRRLKSSATSLHPTPNPLTLQAYYNALEGELPRKMPPNLIQLALTGNSFTGSVPALPRGMKYLSLAENGLQGPLPNGPGAAQLWFVSHGCRCKRRLHIFVNVVDDGCVQLLPRQTVEHHWVRKGSDPMHSVPTAPLHLLLVWFHL
jgi:hypothetical protein